MCFGGGACQQSAVINLMCHVLLLFCFVSGVLYLGSVISSLSLQFSCYIICVRLRIVSSTIRITGSTFEWKC
jgi:hypothetical protein